MGLTVVVMLSHNLVLAKGGGTKCCDLFVKRVFQDYASAKLNGFSWGFIGNSPIGFDSIVYFSTSQSKKESVSDDRAVELAPPDRISLPNKLEVEMDSRLLSTSLRSACARPTRVRTGGNLLRTHLFVFHFV